LSVNPALIQKQVADIIEQIAQKVGNYNYITTVSRPNGTWNNEMGYRMVNAYEAVKIARDYCYTITLTGTQTTKRIECNIINVENATVSNGIKLELKAREKVVINSGFKVESGSIFIVE
jgi:hypothetical protein